jgi:YjbR
MKSLKKRGPGTRDAGTVTAKDFRRIALSFEGAQEGSHMGAVDFRVGGRIFATLASVKEGYGNLMLTPEMQAEFIGERPDLFLPVHGGWGRMGITHIRLWVADEHSLRGALHAAWKLRVNKNGKTVRGGSRRGKPAKRA